jgi:cytosine/adenosine deaminase-related metal-dependent hydrolase
MNAHPTLLSAAWVAPMDQPPIADGGVLIADGKILAVGKSADLRRASPGAAIEELPGLILTPGLVNAHVHLELSDLRQGPPPSSFVDWLLGVIAQTPRLGETQSETIEHAVATGVGQSLRFGVMTVGDISKQCMFTRPVLRDGPLRVVSFGEIQAMAQRRGLLDQRLAAAIDTSYDSQWLTVGLTPHAPYTVEPEGYRRSLAWSRQTGRPLATHLAENPDESQFLADHTGPFRHLWEAGINAWDDHVPKFVGGPIRLARDLGLLDHPTLLAHVNYCDDEELTILAAGKASVVYCPRTHVYFGHPPHRWRDMLARGINVAVGTDSCASSPDLNLLDDLRLLHCLAPEVPPERLWHMATLAAARALGQDQFIGSLTPGKHADLAAFPATGQRPLEELLENQANPAQVWIGGREVTATEPK